MEILSTNVLGQLNIFGHNCYPFSVYGTEVHIFQEQDQICLCSFLQTQNSLHLEVHIIFAHNLGYLVDKLHKGPFPDEELHALLELADFT